MTCRGECIMRTKQRPWWCFIFTKRLLVIFWWLKQNGLLCNRDKQPFAIGAYRWLEFPGFGENYAAPYSSLAPCHDIFYRDIICWSLMDGTDGVRVTTCDMHHVTRLFCSVATGFLPSEPYLLIFRLTLPNTFTYQPEHATCLSLFDSRRRWPCVVITLVWSYSNIGIVVGY